MRKNNPSAQRASESAFYVSANWLSIGVSMYPTVVERIRGRLYKPQVTLVSQIPIYFSSSRSYPRSTQKLEQKVEQDAPG
jgi:hypothetical protein